MPVQVPIVKRIDPQAPESVGRITAQAPDAANALKPIGQGVENVLGEVDKYERHTADNEGLKAGSEYNKWYNTRLNGDSATNTLGLRHQKGDPTEAYNNFDKEAQEKYAEIVGRYSSASGYTKRSVESHLISKQNSLVDSRLTAYGSQYSIYEKEITADSTKLEVDGAATSVSMYDGKDPNTLAPFESRISNISQLQIGKGLKDGRAHQAPDGLFLYKDQTTGETVRVNIDKSIQNDIAKETSTATYNAAKVLIDSNQVEKAKEFIKTYDTQIDPVNKSKLTEDLNKLEVNAGALDALEKLGDKPYPELRREISKLPNKTVNDKEIKRKAYEYLDARSRQKDTLEKRDSEDIYNKLAVYGQKKLQAGEYDNALQFQEDPTYKALVDRVTDPKQRKALNEIFNKPDQSDEDVKSAMLEKLRTGNLYGMTGPQLMEQSIGLNKADTTFFQSQWTKANTETESQENAKLNQMHNEIYRQFSAAGQIKYVNGRETPKSIQQRNEFETRVREQADRLPKDMSPAERAIWGKQIVADEIKRIKDSKRSFFERLPKFLGGTDAPPVENEVAPPTRTRGQPKSGGPVPTGSPVPSGSPVPTGSPNPNAQSFNYATLTADQKNALRSEFMAAHGGAAPKSPGEFKEWINSRNKK